jgi:hypothetical protein
MIATEEKPVILFFNDFFGTPVDTERFADAGPCSFTTDRRLFGKAAAVVFHIPSLRRIGWTRKRRSQLWVAWSMESEVNYPALADPGFMRKFDLVMSYRRSADIWCPYLPKRHEFEAALAAPVPPKTGLVAMFQSASIDKSGRNAFARALMAHVDVHSYGRFLNNRVLPDGDSGRATKLSIASRYKFCIGFENSIAEDYVTEKFFDPLLAGSVPIYWGADNAEAFAPGKSSFIDARKFSGAAALAEYLDKLDRDDDAYRAFLAWRDAGLSPAFDKLLSDTAEDPFLKLAEIVSARRSGLEASLETPR